MWELHRTCTTFELQVIALGRPKFGCSKGQYDCKPLANRQGVLAFALITVQSPLTVKRARHRWTHERSRLENWCNCCAKERHAHAEGQERTFNSLEAALTVFGEFMAVCSSGSRATKATAADSTAESLKRVQRYLWNLTLSLPSNRSCPFRLTLYGSFSMSLGEDMWFVRTRTCVRVTMWQAADFTLWLTVCWPFT